MVEKNILYVNRKRWRCLATWLWKNLLDSGKVWMCGKKEGMENEIESTSKRCLYYPLFADGKTELEKWFPDIPLSLVIFRAKNYYLPVLNINHKSTSLYYPICYLFYFVLSFKNACDLHKRVETHSDSDAYSCDVEGCGFTSWTLQTWRRHYKRAHVVSILNSRIKYIAPNDPKASHLHVFSFMWMKEIFHFSIKSSICTYF